MTPELTHTGHTVRVALRTTASAQRAWEAWTDSNHLARWFVAQANGQYQTGNTVTWKFDGFDMDLQHKVLLAEQGRRLVLGAENAGSPFMLEVLFEETEDGAVVRVINSGLGAREDRDDEVADVESGWQLALGVLKHYLEHHWGQDRQCFFAVRETAFGYEQLNGFYREEFKLAQWLTNDGAIVDGKPTVRLLLRDGRTISGPMLADSKREIAVAWDEINGVIEFKVFSLEPGRRAACIRGCGWGLSAEEARVIESSMESALERLVAALEG